jgi:hypothetical protein
MWHRNLGHKMKREEYEEYESTFLRVNKHTEKKTDL